MSHNVLLSLDTMTGVRELFGLPSLKLLHQGSPIPPHFIRLVRPQLPLAMGRMYSAFD